MFYKYKIIKIMVSGAPASELVKEKTGADFYRKDAFYVIEIASEIYS